MPEYRIRVPFRVAAALPALLFLPGGLGLMLISLSALQESPGSALPGALLGLMSLALGGLCLRITVTGRVPATLEEYGLDDPTEIERLRAHERANGRLVD